MNQLPMHPIPECLRLIQIKVRLPKLLFAQFSIQPQLAILALASGYVFSGSFAFLQTLAFPGAYAPDGLIGDGPNTPAWIHVLWHTTFPAAILAYAALSKDTIGVGKL